MAEAFGSYGDFHGFTLDDVKGMSTEEQVDMIVDWFNYHFEDPQNDTPYNKDLGGYVFLWGGPFDANETIQDFFSDAVDFDTMMLAVDHIQRDGTLDWAPTTRGDFYEHPDEEIEEEELTLDTLEEVPNEPEARAEVLARLDELEALVQPILDQANTQAPPMMGHNNPPEELEVVQAVPKEEWQNIKLTIEVVRTEVTSEEPDLKVVDGSKNLFISAAKALGIWIKNRVNAAVDAGAAFGAVYGITNPEAAKAALINAAQAIQNWVASLPLPF